MKQLELKHIAPYLPYNLRFVDKTDNDRVSELLSVEYDNDEGWNIRLDGWSFCCSGLNHGLIKPILRPLPELFTHNYKEVRDTLHPELDIIEDLFIFSNKSATPLDRISYNAVTVLLKHHFDVFGLIDQGLAVDLNKIK